MAYLVAVRSIFLFIVNVLRLLLWPLWLLRRSLTAPRGPWIRIKLSGGISVFDDGPRWFRNLKSKSGTVELVWLHKLVARLCVDKKIQYVLLEVYPLQCGWSEVDAIRQAMSLLRQRGKQLVVYLPKGGHDKELYLASVAQRVYMSPHASIELFGFYASMPYLAEGVQKLGVGVDAIAIGDFKTALEPLLRQDMSDAQREQMTLLLSQRDAALRAALVERWDESMLQILSVGPTQGLDAVSKNLVDGAFYPDELSKQLEVSDKAEAAPISAKKYLRWRTRSLWIPVRKKPSIAVMKLSGSIIDRRAPDTISWESLRSVFAMLRDNRSIKGVVLHISSPGGSALASDLIHREIIRLKKKKPVVACIGAVAASGGYYLAAGCDAIVADDFCITGSIGVFAAKPIDRGLSHKLGIRFQEIKASEHADRWSITRGFSEAERDALQASLLRVYDRFIEVVAQGRNLDTEVVTRLAGGRVWSGQSARESGLADRRGGLSAAFEEVAARVDHGTELSNMKIKCVRTQQGIDSFLRGIRPHLFLGAGIRKPWLARLIAMFDSD